MYIVNIIKEGLKYKDFCNILENKRNEILCIDSFKTVNQDFETIETIEVYIYYKNNIKYILSFSNIYETEVINKIEEYEYFNKISGDKLYNTYLNKENIHLIKFIENRFNEYHIHYENFYLDNVCNYNYFLENIIKNKININTDYIKCIYVKDLNNIEFKKFKYLNAYYEILYSNKNIDLLTKEKYNKIKNQINLIKNINNF